MSGSRPHRQLGRQKWTGGAWPSTGLAHPKPTSCHSSDLTGHPEADCCSSIGMVRRANVQGASCGKNSSCRQRTRRQGPRWYCVDLPVVPGYCRMPSGSPPMQSRLPGGTPSQRHCGGEQSRAALSSPAFTMTCRGVLYWVISAPLPKLENSSTCSRKDCKMKSRRDCV